MIKPFVLISHEDGIYSLIWSGFNRKYSEIFKKETQGHERGDGYSWNNLLLKTFEHEKPEILSELMFDPSANLICLFSRKKQVLAAAAAFFTKFLNDENFLIDSIRSYAA